MSVRDLPTLADVAAARVGKPLPKGKTRLQTAMDAKPLTKVDEQQFKAEVWRRDRSHCRCCGRKVQKTLGRVPARGEVHHLHGRTGDLRFESRAAVLLCLRCHERVTGRVNQHRVVVVASRTFTTGQGTFTDARYPVTFRAVT